MKASLLIAAFALSLFFAPNTVAADQCAELITKKCTACERCVDVCPKDLFSIHPVSHQLWVACKNLLDDDEAVADCEVACTACERCVKDAPAGLIEIRDNLAVIDYEKNKLASIMPIMRCPTGAIVWLDEDAGVAHKGKEAKRIIRTAALPVG